MAKQNKFYENPLVARKTKESLRSEITSMIRSKVKDLKIDSIDNINDVIPKVADVYVDQLLEVKENLANTTLIVGSANKKAFPDTNTVSSKIHKQLYDKLNENNFFTDIENVFGSNKTQTGSQLYKNVIAYDKTHNVVTNKSNNRQNVMNWNQTYGNVLKLKTIKENGGHLITFDTETLSGLNEFGHNALEHITEISATVHELKDGKMTRVRRIDSVLGLDEDQYKAALKRLENIKNKGIKSLERGSSDAVFFDRMNIYSTAKTVQDGFEFHVTEAAGIDDIKTSIENARKGIENLYNIGKQQTEWIKNNVSTDVSLNKYQRQYVADINNLISTGNYKGQTYNDYVVLGQNSSVFDIPKMQIFGGNTINTERHLDLYQANLMIQDVLGPNAMYANGVKASSKYGRATQENLSSSHGYKISGKAAHIAQTDQEELARMMIQPMNASMDLIANEFEKGIYDINNNSYLELLLDNVNKVNKQLEATSSTYTGANQLFYMDYTQQKAWSDQEGALSFAFDPTSKKFKTFDGFNINDGARNTGYKQYGARSGTLATHEVIQVNTTEQFKELFKNIPGISEDKAREFYQNIANANELYLIKTQEYIDRAALEKKMGKESADFFMQNQRTVYTIETNKDRLGANFGIHVGDLQNGNIVNVQQHAIDSLGLQYVTQDGKGKITTEILDSNKAINSLKEKTINRAINDSAARQIRELDYGNLHKLINFEKTYATNEIKNPITHHALQYSQQVASGKPVDLKIQEELGYIFDFKTGQKTITPERVRNSAALESYIQGMMPIFDKIENILDSKYGKFDIKTHNKSNPVSQENYIKREMGFKQLLNDFLLQADRSVPGGVHSARDLNKIDFNTSKVFTKDFLSQIGTSSNANVDDIFSIDLNKQNSLLDTFYKNKFGDVEERVMKNSAAGWTALTDAFNAFREDSRFNNKKNGYVWNGLSVENLRKEGYSVIQANDIMMDRVRSFVNKQRETDSGFGLLYPRNVQDVIDIDKINQLASLNEAQVDKILNEVSGNLRDDVMLVAASGNREALELSNKKHIDHLVENYFMGYSEKEFNDSLKGYTAEQQKVLKLQDKINRRTAREYATDLIQAIAGEDNLAYMVTQSKNGAPILSLVHDGNVTQLNAQRFTLNKGISTSTIGNNEYVNRLALGFSNKFDATPLLTSTSEKARLKKSIQHRIKWAKDRGDSVADAIIGTIKDRSKMVAEATTRIDYSNGQLFAQAFGFDVNDMIKMLPMYASNGTLEKIEDKFGIKDETRQVMRGLVDDIKKNSAKYDDKAFTKVLPRELNHFMQYYKPLLNEIKDDISIPGAGNETEYFRGVMDYVQQKTKTTALRRGIDSIDPMYYMDAFAEIDDTKRPPMTQMANTILYDKDEVIERLKDTKGIKAKNTPVATNSLAEKFLYNNTSKLGDSTGTSGLTMKFLQIDSYSLQDIFLDEKKQGSKKMNKYLEGKTNFKENAADILYERATSLSTYEQQGLINSRVSDTSFHRINTQKINASKQMILNMDSDLETITYVKNANKLSFEITEDGKVVYNNGYHVRAGDTLGRFGNEDFSSIKTAKYDGIFRGRFFNEHGNVVSTSKINELLAKQNLSGTAEIKEWLMDNFQFKYELMPVKEMHGMKVFMGPSEKTTTDSLKMAVGSLDKGIVSELKELGLGHLGGSVTYADYLYGDVRKTLEDAGRMDLWDRVLNERHALSDYMQEFDKFKGVGFVSAVNVDKHNSVSVLMQSFMTELQDKGLITEDNMDIVFGKGNYKIINNDRVDILPSMSKITTNFEEGSALDDAWKRTLANFKEGSGYANIVQGYDDTAGTFAGKAQDISKELNLLDRQIRKAENINGDLASYKEKANKLLLEKDELLQIIDNVDKSNKVKKQEMLDVISANIDKIESDLGIIQNTKDSLYKQKSDLYKLQKESDKTHSWDDPYKVKLRGEMLELDEMIDELNNEYSSLLKNLDSQHKDKKSIESNRYGEPEIVRKQYGKRIDEINRELKEGVIKNVESGEKFKVSDLTKAEIDAIQSSNTDYINELKLKRANLERQANAMEDFKGVKFSDAMGQNLDRTTFNPDLVKKLQESLDEETFQKYFGYAMDGNVVKSEYLGTSMADPITGRLRKQLSSQDNSLLLKDVLDGGRLEEQYGYLVDAVKNSGGEIGDVSVATAENMYSYNQGLKAMRYNEALAEGRDDYRARKALTESKLGAFKEIDYSDLELDIAGQGKQIVNSEFNPYTNNLIINTGLGGKYNEVAIARMPEVHAGDSLIKKEHIKQVSVLKDKLMQYHGATNEEDKATYLKNAISQIDYIRELQKQDITSKTGLIKDGTEFRMNESFFGKASGININSYVGNTDLFGILAQDMQSIERRVNADLSKEDILNTLQEKNARLANKTFNGKSLLEHYAEGRLIDTAFVSEEMFENLGYFDKDSMERTFSSLNNKYKEKLSGFNLESYEGQRSAMKHLLSTEGDAFITVRYPEIMAGSDKFAQVYLDDSLKANQVMVMGATGMSAKLDHDGDQFAAARVTTSTNQSKLTASMTAMDQEAELMSRALDSSMMVRAATDNMYWENQVKEHIMKERGFATSVSEMRGVAGKRRINGQIYTSKINDPNLTLEDLHGLKDKYLDVLKIDMKDYKGMDDAELVEMITAKSGGLSEEEAINEYMAAWSYADTEDMITAKIYQNAVGETNVTNQKVKKIVTDLMDKTAEDYEYKQQILGDFLYRAEEGAISSKSSVEGLEPDRAKNWNDAVTGVLKGENVSKNQAVMRDWLQDNVQDQAFIESYYARSSYFADSIKEKYGIDSFRDFKNLLEDKSIKSEIMNQVTDDVVETISEFSGHEGMRAEFDSLRLGVSQTGVKSSTAMTPSFIKGARSNTRSFYEVNEQLFGSEGLSFTEITPAYEQTLSNKAFRESVEEIMSSSAQAASKVSTDDMIGDIIEGVGDFAKSVSGKKLAMGAVGIAAGIMVAGYVGGRPRPADVHAMEEASDYQTPMEGYQLADPGMAMASGQQGYVININARTNKGRQNAIAALEQAIANGSSTNVNIAMNITDDYGNINDRQIEQAILGAF